VIGNHAHAVLPELDESPFAREVGPSLAAVDFVPVFFNAFPDAADFFPIKSPELFQLDKIATDLTEAACIIATSRYALLQRNKTCLPNREAA
jgi:hypothetical protein